MAKKNMNTEEKKPTKLQKKKMKLEKQEEKLKEKEEKRRAKLIAKGVDPDDIPDVEDTVGGKLAIFVVTLVIIAIWLAILALLIRWDVGGFGSTVLTPIFKDVPYINKILPETEEDLTVTETVVDSEYPYASLDDAIDRIKELEIQVEDLKKESEEKDEQISDLSSVEQELADYKAKEAEFEAEKEKFYQEVVFSDNAPDISEYKSYYESIEPDTAEQIYKQVVEQLQYDDEVTSYAETYSSMKPKQAAAAFDAMTDNLELVSKILNAMDTESRAKIMDAMSSTTVAKLAKIMEPTE